MSIIPEKYRSVCLATLLMGCTLSASLFSQSTVIHYLSGTGYDRTVEWDFFCTGGRNSGTWGTIKVPSCWEQEGFGEYNYGHVPFEERLKEEGQYRYLFEVPKDWKGKHINLVFEGVMTDCHVLVNGKPAGADHQGAFYPFSYDVSRLLKYGQRNKLEVFVKKFSDNMSVNEAERAADYWVFGGIFRPVYLEVNPAAHIGRVAVDARADGTFRSEVFLEGVNSAGTVRVAIKDNDGSEVAVFEGPLNGNRETVLVEGNFPNPRLWSPEFPHLYTAVFSLLDQGGTVIHQLSERIGFRTVEIRDQDGIYVNDVRIKFKGVNRHSFHPDHGRTSSKTLSIEVVNLIKDMNMNAVRMSHYPPDRHFLEVCDSLGLFVLDELAGWQWPPYDSVVGRQLLGEMIARDVNHPSVVMWDNANEGGWNTALDKDFKHLDIQQREVNHPWSAFGKGNTAHYVDYNYLSMDNFAPRSIFFSTEMIHGLYDGGAGAGLEDFWLRMWAHPLSAGGFIWVFADEAVKRTDKGSLDADGNHAPDGIVGPYHEKEGSFFAIREVWSPIHFEKRYITPGFNGRFRIQNRFHYTNLDQCSFTYQWIQFNGPSGSAATLPDAEGAGTLLDQGQPRWDPLEPGQNGSLQVPMPQNWKEADVLYVEAWDPHGRLIHRWSWPAKPPDLTASEILDPMAETGQVIVSETEGNIILESDGINVQIAKRDGRLDGVFRKGKLIPISDGPLFREDDPLLQEVSHFSGEEGSHHVVARFGNGDRLEWIMHPGGLLDMVLRYQPESDRISYTGASFSYPENGIKMVKYLGDGPYPVWKNRMSGVNFNVWEKEYNNTITGYSGYDYPPFRGYYSNLYWAKFTDQAEQSFTVFCRTEDVFLRLFTPGEPPEPALTTLQHPRGELSFMLGIPAIGTKFKNAEQLGPQSQKYQYLNRRVKDGALHIALTFDFR